MQTATAGHPPLAPPPPPRARAVNDLINLAAPLFELVLKVRAGTVEPSNEIRPVVDGLLRQLEQGGVQIRCHPRQVADVKFALVAFIDETVLSPENNFPLRQDWERTPLQLVYFEEHLAGLRFFDRLDHLLRDVETNADVVEVYYLCLLLGFKGKYNINFLADQLRETIAGVAAQLRAVGRLKPNALSAHWRADDQPEPPRPRSLPLWAKLGASALLCLVIFAYLLMYVLLQRELTIVR
jgi:type VI secretion system protein ImpK